MYCTLWGGTKQFHHELTYLWLVWANIMNADIQHDQWVLTHCPLGDVALILNLQISNVLQRLLSWWFPVLCLWVNMYRTLLVSQPWFRWWLGAVRPLLKPMLTQMSTYGICAVWDWVNELKLMSPQTTQLASQNLCQHWVRKWLTAWLHQAITWTMMLMSAVNKGMWL